MKKLLIYLLLPIIGIVGYSFVRSQKSPDSNEVIQTDEMQVADKYNNWQQKKLDEVDLTFKIPPDTTLRKEVADNVGVVRVLGFYVENSDTNNPYTLYGVYQADKEASSNDLEKAKIEMVASTITPVEIDGFGGIEGLIEGEKSRYITILLIDNKLFSFSTIPPTQENKTMTDNILATFDFDNDN